MYIYRKVENIAQLLYTRHPASSNIGILHNYGTFINTMKLTQVQYY